MQISYSPIAETTNACRGLNTTTSEFFNLHNKIAKLIILLPLLLNSFKLKIFCKTNKKRAFTTTYSSIWKSDLLVPMEDMD